MQMQVGDADYMCGAMQYGIPARKGSFPEDKKTAELGKSGNQEEG